MPSMDADWKTAIERGDVQVILDLLGRGADVNARDRYGQTACNLAAERGLRELSVKLKPGP